MDYTGIGILLIGISVLLSSIYLARVLNKVANVIGGVNKTVEQLPEQLETILNETGKLIHHSNDTLADLNEKIGTLTPYFHIVGDIGESTRTLSSSLVRVTKARKSNTDNKDVDSQDKRLGGIYGTAALSYYLNQKRRGSKVE